MKFSPLLLSFCLLSLGAAASAAKAAPRSVLRVFGAGTLAVPFRQLDKVFEKTHPDVVVQPEFGGSVKMARRITELGKLADVIGVADYHVIPKYMFAATGRKAYANWYAGFAGNAITFAYTKKSRYASDITARNWYKVLARPSVAIGRSDPNTDPSGYQILQMLNLAAKYYADPTLAAGILANAPRRDMRDTETSLLSALQLGEIDYLAIYRSDAMQHGLEYIKLPAKIDLSDPADASFYKSGVAHTKNGTLPGKPIVYAVTIPTNAPEPRLAAEYVALLLGPKGQAVMAHNGFRAIKTAYGVGESHMPAAIRAEVTAWPKW
ncbi:MAG: extracellular solute-binding protein [Acetobacteraceae bacterium]